MIDDQEKKQKSAEAEEFVGEDSTLHCKNIVMGKKEITGAVLPTIIFNSDAKIKISREDLKQIFIIENQIRLAPETIDEIDKFTQVDYEKFFKFDEFIIRSALKKFGFNPSEDDSFKAYLIATGKHVNDRELKELVVWLKYDKMKLGELRKGCVFIPENAPNQVELYSLDGKQKFLLKELMSDTKYNIVVSGSYS